jgi:hypothetical protein
MERRAAWIVNKIGIQPAATAAMNPAPAKDCAAIASPIISNTDSFPAAVSLTTPSRPMTGHLSILRDL